MKQDTYTYTRANLVYQFYLEFTGFDLVQQRNIPETPSYFAGTLGTLGRLEKFIATTICCLCDETIGIVCGHCQKLYHDTYFAVLPIAQDPLGRHIAAFAEQWRKKDLSSSAVMVDGNAKPTISATLLVGIAEVHVPSGNKRHFSFSLGWLL